MAAPEAQNCDVIVAAATPVDPDPAEVLEATTVLLGRPDVICLTDGEDPREEARLLAAGAIAAVPITLPDDELKAVFLSIFQRRRDLHPKDRDRASSPLPPPPESIAMVELLALADRVASGDSSVLVLGETGTGKEWLARRLHERSPRVGGKFVPVNCAAIPEGLVESELFGHMRGAFTGAIRSKRGHFEVAHGGTLFLDEIADISPAVQGKLLRVLQDHEVQPVGSERAMQVDVRVIAATSRNLDEAIKEGGFRQDLYYRLAVITLNLPPLRERREDIPGLVEVYARHFAALLGRPNPQVSASTIEALSGYAWPGNIRELINVVERAVLLNSGPGLELVSLPTNIWADPRQNLVMTEQPLSNGHPVPHPYADARREAIRAFEFRYLTALLKTTHGRVGEAARRSGMSLRSLYSKMKAHELRKEDFRD
jgi:DNA-binding NtrC family response regulator